MQSGDALEIPCMPVVHGVPESHWNCTFGNFDFTTYPVLKALTTKFLDRKRIFWLYLAGPTGRGKTHYAVALHRAIVARVGWEGVESSAFTEWQTMSEELRESFSDYSYDERMRAYLEPETLIIDDLIGKLRDFQVRMLEEIIRERHARKKRLIVTSNESFDSFTSMFSAHEVSRITSVCVAVELGGPDRRLAE